MPKQNLDDIKGPQEMRDKIKATEEILEQKLKGAKTIEDQVSALNDWLKET